MSDHSNALRVAHVERCFGTHGVPLQKEGRQLLGEGLLMKICRKTAKPRQFFLFSDILVYGTTVQERKKYTRQHILPLANMGIISLPDTQNELKNVWIISSEYKSFVVVAATAQEKSEWMLHLSRASGSPILTPAEATERFKGHAPTWTPDRDANICMRCKVTKFSPIVRRHHCRKCGIVCCSSCSSKRLSLPKISKKPSRVCDDCFEKHQYDGYDDLDGKMAEATLGEVKPTGTDEDDEDADAVSPISPDFSPQASAHTDLTPAELSVGG